MFNLARVATLWNAALQTARLHRSGLFSAEQYLKSNPDLSDVRQPLIFHFCRFGQFEQRDHGQSPFQSWLIPKVLDGAVTSKHANTALRRYKRAETKQDRAALIDELAARNNLSSDLLNFYLADTSQEFTRAAQYLSSVPIEDAFLYHYQYARKHFLLEPLQEAYAYASERLEKSAFTRVEEVVAAQGIANSLEHPGTDRSTFSRLILNNVIALRANNPAEKLRQFWQVGLPILDDGSDLAAQLLSELPNGTQQQLIKARAAIPESCAKWETLINLQTVNLLNNEQRVLSKTGHINPLSPERHHETIRFRMLGEGYWRLADNSPLFNSIVQASRTALDAAFDVYDHVLPDYGLPIFDVRGQRNTDFATLSYHTVTRPEQRYINYKESALPGYFSFDPCGYSGWSSWQGPDDLGTKRDEAAKFFQALASDVIETQRSKYTEVSTLGDIPDSPFVLIALQVPDDTVAQHACLTRAELLQTVCEYYSDSETNVLIKLHPHDRSDFSQKTVEDFCSRYTNVGRVTGAIHPILEKALLLITVNSGVGFEALLHEKLVISTGGSEYTPCAIHASNRAELIEALDKAEHIEQNLERKNFVKSYVYSFLREACFKTYEHSDSLRKALTEIKLA